MNIAKTFIETYDNNDNYEFTYLVFICNSYAVKIEKVRKNITEEEKQINTSCFTFSDGSKVLIDFEEENVYYKKE